MKSIVILGNYFINADVVHKTEWDMRSAGSVWMLNSWHKGYKIKPDLIFNIHEDMFAPSLKTPRYAQISSDELHSTANAYNDAGCKTLILGANEMLNDVEWYPLDAVVGMFGKDVLTSSITYMLACAYLYNAKKIHLWGFNMINDIEYEPQIPAVLHMINELEKMGVSVEAPMRCRWLEEAMMRGVQWMTLPKLDVPYHDKNWK